MSCRPTPRHPAPPYASGVYTTPAAASPSRAPNLATQIIALPAASIGTPLWVIAPAPFVARKDGLAVWFLPLHWRSCGALLGTPTFGSACCILPVAMTEASS